MRTSLKLTLAPNLTFTADPSYFWTVASGGGTSLVAENDARVRDLPSSLGVDLNGDGDILDNNTAGSTSTPAAFGSTARPTPAPSVSPCCHR